MWTRVRLAANGQSGTGVVQVANGEKGTGVSQATDGEPGVLGCRGLGSWDCH